MKKKLLVCVLAALMLVPSASAFAEQMIVLNCNDWVSLRAQPSTSAERLSTVPLGSPVESIGWSNGFNQVVYNGMTGWILTEYLGYGVPFTKTDNSLQVTNCNEWVSLRSYPGTSAPAITTVPLGEWVESIGWENGFNQVVYYDMTGWILSEYLSDGSNQKTAISESRAHDLAVAAGMESDCWLISSDSENYYFGYTDSMGFVTTGVAIYRVNKYSGAVNLE